MSRTKLTVQFRADRSLLASLEEQGAMKCMLKVADLRENNEEKAKQIASDWMCDLARRFANDEVRRTDPYQELCV